MAAVMINSTADEPFLERRQPQSLLLTAMPSTPFLPEIVQLRSHSGEHRGKEAGEKGVDSHDEQADNDHGDDDAADGVDRKIASFVGQFSGNSVADLRKELLHIPDPPLLPVCVKLLLHAVEHSSKEAGEEGSDGRNEQTDENHGDDDTADGVDRKIALAVGQLAPGLGHAGLNPAFDVFEKLLHDCCPPLEQVV